MGMTLQEGDQNPNMELESSELWFLLPGLFIHLFYPVYEMRKQTEEQTWKLTLFISSGNFTLTASYCT